MSVAPPGPQVDEAAPASPQTAPGLPWSLSRWLPLGALCVLAASGLALFLMPLRGIDLSRMNGLGLISVLPRESLAGAGLLVLAFILTLGLGKHRPVILSAMLVAIVICLDGVTVIAEPEPRFATAYQIAGFVEYISRTGHAAPGIAAYFSWPGFLALVAFVEGVAGNHDLIPVLRLWPVTVDLLCLVPLFLIMRNLRMTWRAMWFAAFLFCVGNWVGQDYFSPQAFNYLLYLVFIALLVNWFSRSTPTRLAPGQLPGGSLRAACGGGWQTSSPAGSRCCAGAACPSLANCRAWPVGTGQRAILLTLVIAIFVASTVSHQLTPFFMLLACGGLVLVRRCAITGLPLLLAVILVAWISFAAAAFWSGHQSDIFGGIGHLSANLSTSVAGRVAGSTPQHARVLYVRTALAAVAVIMAVLGLARRRYRGIADRAALVLLCVPFLAFGLQSYGGEIALRIYLFALPAACILGAFAFFPAARNASRSWRALAAAVACGLVLVVAFFVARYGNEAFEQVPRGELTAMNYIYSHDSAGTRLAWLSPAPSVDNTPQMPWQYRDIEKVDYIPAQAPQDPASVTGLVGTLRTLGPGSYLITTRTQETYLQQAASYQPGWGSQFRAHMAAAPGVQVVFADHDAVIYALRGQLGAHEKPLVLNTRGFGIVATPWTPAGLIVLGLLVLVLAAREFARVCLPPQRWLRQTLTLASLPLLAALLAVVVERFIVLS